ncbi:DUF4149 domain-containing protein [Tropicimonas sediminicola]|uniref:TMEM205-like domain-containing protein n=1 Tax=Tropicimonas sediminicola TaxID=1031541 RepID=A0A239C1J2_9RHOB|nr:DUF4149 domain-containing protein [Tropicimonas sediminicola]SNS13243.1 protein of unknown function [Tropicimonas sediminicola]
MTSLALLATALLFGGMILYSFGFAAFLFSALPAAQAGKLLRRAFPHFYLFVLAASALSALLLVGADASGAWLMGLVALTVIPARQVLMPAINEATVTGHTKRFKVLHGLSVALTLCHIAATAAVLVGFT